MVRKMDQYIKWKLAKKMGKMILLYLSISLDCNERSQMYLELIVCYVRALLDIKQSRYIQA